MHVHSMNYVYHSTLQFSLCAEYTYISPNVCACVRACVCACVCVCSRLRACLNVSGIVQMRLLLSCFEQIRERQRQRERKKFRGTGRTWDVMKGEGTKREDSPNILIKHFFRL